MLDDYAKMNAAQYKKINPRTFIVSLTAPSIHVITLSRQIYLNVSLTILYFLFNCRLHLPLSRQIYLNVSLSISFKISIVTFIVHFYLIVSIFVIHCMACFYWTFGTNTLSKQNHLKAKAFYLISQLVKCTVNMKGSFQRIVKCEPWSMIKPPILDFWYRLISKQNWFALRFIWFVHFTSARVNIKRSNVNFHRAKVCEML